MAIPKTEMSVADLLEQANWSTERRKLRAILIGSGLKETVKWNKLVYQWRDRNVAIIYGLADSCAIGFFKGSLLADRQERLVAPGRHSKAMRRLHFRSLAQIEAQEDLIRSTVKEAIDLERQDTKVDFTATDSLQAPAELTDAFAADPDFKQAFDALTPGRQRGYLLHFSEAKRSETRSRRIANRRSAILNGKGMHDR